MRSFRGLKLPGFKDQTLVDRFLYVAHPPAVVTIPLKQHKGEPAKSLVKKGDSVLLGQKIAEASGADSVAVHASVSGEVISIGRFPHPALGLADAIQIKNNGKEMPYGPARSEKDSVQKVDDELMRIVEDAGLIDFDREGSPLAAKLNSARGRGTQTLIVDACESEPFITSLHIMMVAKPSEILRGVLLAQRLSGASNTIVAIGENKLDALEVLGSKLYSFNTKDIVLKKLPVRYPQEGTTGLASALLGDGNGRQTKPRQESALILNMATCFALSEAVYSGKPLYERVITVAGQSIAKPKNLLVRIGTSLENVLAECGGTLRSPLKVLTGGPMNGRAQVSLAAPITKQTSALLALAGELRYPGATAPCIRCGACADACPSELEPAIITLAAEQDEFETVRDSRVSECIECGNCTYICPSNRPMASLLEYAKSGVGHSANRAVPLNQAPDRRLNERRL